MLRHLEYKSIDLYRLHLIKIGIQFHFSQDRLLKDGFHAPNSLDEIASHCPLENYMMRALDHSMLLKISEEEHPSFKSVLNMGTTPVLISCLLLSLSFLLEESIQHNGSKKKLNWEST
ncbi:hypothetical protein AMTRI_Chr02g257910 [Amborella trichopoda]